MNFNKVDLNLFIVFDAIYTAGNLTKAGEVLCITQPAVSNSLARLRDLFNDPLFVRTGQTMTPTPVAQNIIGPAREALKLLRQSVQDGQSFDPSVADKAFVFCMRDLFEASIFARLLARLEDSAPNLKVKNVQIKRDEIANAMAAGKLDFYADASSYIDPHLCKHKIAQDRFVVVARKDHPEIGAELTLEKFLQLGHIHISQRPEGVGHIDIALDTLGHKRNVVMRGQHFLTAPTVLVKTKLIACLPYHFAKHFDLAIYEMPFEIPNLEYFLYWHISSDHDPAHRWLREQIIEIAKSFKLHVPKSAG